jgi:fatty-acyl-CoA synthase
MQEWSFGAVFARLNEAFDPDLPAVIHGDRQTSWRDFDRRTDALAAAFRRAAEPSDRVAHLMRNTPAYSETIVAAFKSRLVHVNVNYRYTGEELLYILDNSSSAVVVFDAEFAEVLDTIRDRLPTKLWVQVGGETAAFAQDFDTLAESGAKPPPQQHSGDDLLLLYTGGTTGYPKGVMWDQHAFWHLLNPPNPALGLMPAESIDEHLERVRAGIGRQRSLILPPLMHGTGMVIMIGTLMRGGTVVTLPSRSFEPELAARTCEELGCDYAVVVGDAFARPLLNALDAGIGRISTVATMISSGVMWSPEVKAGLLRHAPNMMIIDSFGSSEGLGLGAAVQTKDNAGAETRFVHDGNTLVIGEDMQPVAPGEVGKIARGGHIPRGYWRDEAKSAATFVKIGDKRYSIPGDFARLEADGSITLLGRGSQCINTAGEKVFPEEVEETLKTHPAIEDALVFGVPDDRWGQAVMAVAQARSPVEEAELVAHVRQHLAGYKAPKRIMLVPEVPRAPNGKADYATARTMFNAA